MQAQNQARREESWDAQEIEPLQFARIPTESHEIFGPSLARDIALSEGCTRWRPQPHVEAGA